MKGESKARKHTVVAKEKEEMNERLERGSTIPAILRGP
jgi:hypothetical protein